MNQTNPPPSSRRPARQSLNVEALDTIVGYRLRRAQVTIFQRFTKRFAELALRPAEFSVLVLIEDNPGSRQTEIANALGIKRANFVALIRRLDERGLTERRQPQDDRRSNALFLTPAGKKFVARANAIQAEFERECTKRLGSDAERQQLMGLLSRLID